MHTIGNIFVGCIALEHFFFLLLEMFFWMKPLGLKIFRQKEEQAKISKVLAANQGLYNGFLAAGLLWSLLQPEPFFAEQLKIFFLFCVLAAGAYGAFTVNIRLFFVQALPAMLAFACLFFL